MDGLRTFTSPYENPRGEEGWGLVAQLGVAMGQASEKVSRVSDATTKSNDEDGVAHAIAAILASCTASA